MGVRGIVVEPERGEASSRATGDALPILIILGRSNNARGCAAIDAVARDYAGLGGSVEAQGNRYEQAVRALNEVLERRLPRALFALCMGNARPARALRSALRYAALPGMPRHWNFPWLHMTSGRRGQIWLLARRLDRHPRGGVVLLAHSAGGILGARVAKHPAVRRLICFGYPFRHPDQGEQPYRTRPLARIARPMLVIQGDADPYGAAGAARRYRLSAHVTVEAVAADHDYAIGDVRVLAAIRRRVIGFALGEDASAGQAEAVGDHANDARAGMAVAERVMGTRHCLIG